ncbi:uncharacterized protein ARMOST_20448 [Armillaria ostoyae]|uniref:Uncharacterized protein n=1 Tax=Armillaria ostoyae TaxID=47428 RepID=A0A284S7H7_ARMOS|nr:uncharacterized protein ARMOST_20448 [Armillaria ostoyae]
MNLVASDISFSLWVDRRVLLCEIGLNYFYLSLGAPSDTRLRRSFQFGLSRSTLVNSRSPGSDMVSEKDKDRRRTSASSRDGKDGVDSLLIVTTVSEGYDSLSTWRYCLHLGELVLIPLASLVLVFTGIDDQNNIRKDKRCGPLTVFLLRCVLSTVLVLWRAGGIDDYESVPIGQNFRQGHNISCYRIQPR